MLHKIEIKQSSPLNTKDCMTIVRQSAKYYAWNSGNIITVASSDYGNVTKDLCIAGAHWRMIQR